MPVVSVGLYVFICFIWYAKHLYVVVTHKMKICFLPTEILPLVEFYPESDINESEVERLLMAPPKPNMGHSDPFADTMIHEDITDALPLTLDRDALRAVDPITVLIVKWPKPLKTKYYRNLLPELQISICPECLQVIFIEQWISLES